MKRLWSAAAMLAVLVVLVLGAYTENRADGTALNFPDAEWGMTWEEVMSAGGIAQEDVNGDDVQTRFSSSYVVKDREVFGEQSSGAYFDFIDLGGGTQRLISVMVYYPDDADMAHVLEEMTKAYGSPVPELIDYSIFNAIVSADSQNAYPLYADQYTESEQMKIWAGKSLSEAIPKDQEQEYMKTWQEKVYPLEGSSTFQPGLSDDQWDEFVENAKMVMAFWMNEAAEHEGGNRVYFKAYNDQVYDEVTRRISEQENVITKQ